MEQAKATIWSRLWGLLAITAAVGWGAVSLLFILGTTREWTPVALDWATFVTAAIVYGPSCLAVLVSSLVACRALSELLGRPRRTGREPAPTAPSDPD